MNPNNVNFVIYHGGCVDGFGAAWAAWKLLGDSAEYFPAYHGKEPPNVTGKNVAILDFSYSKEVTQELAKVANSIVILDHHASNQEALSNFDFAIFDMSRSGAMMSWNFFHSGKKAPLFIEYIQDRDLWKWNLPNSAEFSAAFHEVPFSFKEYDCYLIGSNVDHAIMRGSHIVRTNNNLITSISKGAVDRTLLGKYNCKVVNSSMFRSEVGNLLAKECNGIGVVWSFNHKNQAIHVSFRSNDDEHNVAKIAKVLGDNGFAFGNSTNSGGHPKAAGLVMPASKNIEDIFNFIPSSEMNSDI
jgi:oligoribonuclease NrnB/cAMP/cGMP phosphodiesterase (DHH superfamily)